MRNINSTATRTILGSTICLAAVLRAINANAELWWDEIVTVMTFVRPPLGHVMSTYELAGNHVMNSVLTNLVGHRFGMEPWLVRMPAIVFGVAGVWAFWFVAARIWERVPALVGTLLFAVSYHHVYYSQNARGYTAFIFFGLVATGLLLRLLPERRPSWLVMALYAGSLGAGLYAMLLMLFVVAGHGLVLIGLRRWRLLSLPVVGMAIAAALYAPMALSVIEFYRTHPGDTGYPLFSMPFARSLAPLAPLLVLGAIVMIPVVVRMWRSQRVALVLLLTPIVFNVLVPLLRGQGVYPRAFIFALPVGYLLIVELLSWARDVRPMLAWAIATAVIAVSLVRLVPFYQLPKQGFQQALAFIDTQARTGDRRVGLTVAGKAARFYDPRYTLIEDATQLDDWLSREGASGAWVVSTFATDLQTNHPRVDEWLRTRTSDRAEFAGVIGDGTVHVRYWPGTANPAR